MTEGIDPNEEFQDLAGELDGWGQELRSVAREAESGEHGSAPGSDRVEATLREAFRSPAQEIPRTRLLWALSAAAAVALMAGAGWALWPRTQEPAEPGWGMTLGSEVELLAPVGAGARFDSFRWDLGSSAPDSVRITVYDASTGATLDQVTVDADAPWSPPGTDAWPGAIRWTLEPVLGGTILQPFEASASR